MKRIIFILLIFPLVFFSCKKDEDTEPPVIEIYSPADGSQADVYDTLHIRFHVSDNEKIENVRVQLVTTNLSAVLPALAFPAEGNVYNGEFDYIISNRRIESGNYYLSVEAFDGTNTGHAYASVYVTGIPRELKGFFAATIPTPGTLTIYKGDSSWTASVYDSYASDFTDLAVSDYWQQVYASGMFTGPLKATSIDGTSGTFSIPSISGPTPYWGPMAVTDKRLWVSYRATAQIKSFDDAAMTYFTSPATTGFYPRLSVQAGNRLYSEQKDISSPNVRMVVYSTAGGALQETPMSMDAVAMFEKDADNIYVVGNTGAQGHLMIYDYPTNGFWEPISLPAAMVMCAAQISPNELLIAMSNGTIYRFTYMPVGLISWASGINTSILRYDDVNAEIYSAEGNDVKVYSYSPFVLQHTIALPNAVSDLELWFNK